MIDVLKEYATKKADLLKLEATEKGSLTAGNLFFLAMVCFVFLFFVVLLSVGLGLLIGYYLDNYAWGMLIIAGIYFILLVIILLSKNAIRNSIANKIIQSLNR